MLSQTNKQTGYPSVDKPWLKYYSSEDFEVKVPACTVYQNIYDRNKDYPEDTALLYYGNKIQYKALFSNVEICARALRQIGIRPGECVTLCTAGVPEAIYLVLACSRIGAIANFINPLFTREQMIDRINDTEAEWIFILDAMYSFVEKALPDTCVKNAVIIPATNSLPVIASRILYHKSESKKIMKQGNGRQRFMEWTDFCALSQSFTGVPDAEYRPDTPAVMVYSSGSTGASKGILLTNDGINSFIANYDVQEMQFNRGEKFLQMIPVWFSTGIAYSILMPLAKGFTVIPEPKFSKEIFLRDLKKYKPSITLTATSLWLYVVNSGENVDLSNMKYGITGGEKILPQDEARINDYFMKNGCKKKLYKGYGMCELGSEISGTTDAVNYRDKQGGSGYPILNVSVSAFDMITGKELEYGQHGELRVASPARMKGYYKNPEASAEFFKTDEYGNIWGCTGDIGYVDEDGEVFVLGRATDSCRGENGEIIYLFDIEDLVFKNDNVRQCKVVDTVIDGATMLVCHVVLKEEAGDGKSTLKEIDTCLRSALPEYKVPAYYKIRQSMPVHSNGKRDTDTLKKDREGLIKLH